MINVDICGTAKNHEVPCTRPTSAGRATGEKMNQADTIAEEEALIEEDFSLFDDWRDKIEYILDLGKDVPPMDEALKTDATIVHGCQSRVWMTAELDAGEGVIRFQADSDALLVKGLIALLMRLYANRTPQDILDSPPEVLNRVGLGRHLTPNRTNGLFAMIQRIRELAHRHLCDA